MAIPDWLTLLTARGARSQDLVPLRLLSFDPGGTTGWALFEKGLLQTCGQVPGSHKAHMALVDELQPDIVVIEKYFIYSWKAQEHTWSDLFTPRLIGGVEAYCCLRGIPLVVQTAQDAKAFNSNDKLKAWNMYNANAGHANDAIRHGCHFLLFNWKNHKPMLAERKKNAALSRC